MLNRFCSFLLFFKFCHLLILLTLGSVHLTGIQVQRVGDWDNDILKQLLLLLDPAGDSFLQVLPLRYGLSLGKVFYFLLVDLFAVKVQAMTLFMIGFVLDLLTYSLCHFLQDLKLRKVVWKFSNVMSNLSLKNYGNCFFSIANTIENSKFWLNHFNVIFNKVAWKPTNFQT